MEEYIPSIVVGLTVVSLVAWILLVMRLCDIDDRCLVIDVVMIMIMTSLITACVVGLCIIGFSYALNSRSCGTAQGEYTRDSGNSIQDQERSDGWVSELVSADTGNGARGETVGVQPRASGDPVIRRGSLHADDRPIEGGCYEQGSAMKVHCDSLNRGITRTRAREERTGQARDQHGDMVRLPVHLLQHSGCGVEMSDSHRCWQ